MTVAIEDQPKPKLRIAWGGMLSGLLTAGFAVACGGADLINNAIFGWQKGGLIAAGFVLAAVGLMGLPAKARGLSDVRVWLMVGVCGALSFFAGYKNHTTNQHNYDLAQAAITTRYEQAQSAIKDAEADIRQAKVEIAGIAEQMGSEELQRLHREARDRANKEGSGDRGGCGKRCRAAEDEAKSYLSRIASAKAKEDAQGRLDAAQARMDAEKAKAPQAPKQAGESEHEETLMAVLLLLVTIVGATFFERGVKEIKGAVSRETPGKKRAAPVERKLSVVAEAPVPGKKKSDMDGFLDSWTEASEGPPLQAGEFYKCLVAHWAQHHPGKNVPTTTALGRALGERYARVKTGGKQCYMAKLRRLGAVKAGFEPATMGE